MALGHEIDKLLESESPSIPELVKDLDWLQSTVVEYTVDGKTQDLRIEDNDKLNSLHLEFLKKSLQAAVSLEFTTLPPYFCALWSIKDEMDPTAISIREVVHEEMLHMALACNMLTSIGGVPQITSRFPKYPTTLPGGVHPDLIVNLSGLSKASLNTFMDIESPEKIVPHGHEGNENSSNPTIGRFYQCIEQAFKDLQPEFNTENQIAGPLADMVIKDIVDVTHAIKTIREQGEGSEKSPADTGLDDLAHYYRFEELFVGKKLEFDENKNPPYFHGKDLVWPDVWPMQPVPEGGYHKADVSNEAWLLISKFDETYSRMLDLLEVSWRGGGQGSFLKALEIMFELQKYAIPLMQIPVDNNPSKTLGPCFRYGRQKYT